MTVSAAGGKGSVSVTGGTAFFVVEQEIKSRRTKEAAAAFRITLLIKYIITELRPADRR